MPITMTPAAEDHVLKSLQNRKKGISDFLRATNNMEGVVENTIPVWTR